MATVVDAPWIINELGLALEFDANNSYVYATNQLKRSKGTVSVLVKPYFASAIHGVHSYIFDTSNEAGRYLLYFNAGETDYEWYVGGTLIGGINVSHIADEILLITCTWDTVNDEYYGYKNGVQTFYDGAVNATAQLDALMYFGSRFNAPRDVWNGQILNVRIYNRILNANEITACYQILRRRMQEIGGERPFPIGWVAGVPPAGAPMTPWGGTWGIPT